MDSSDLCGNIIYVASAERAINYKWERDSHKLDPNLQIVSIDRLKEAKSKGYLHLNGFSNISIGQVYARHPFLPDRYVDMNNLEQELFKNKISCLSEIAKWLGVKSVEGEAHFLNEQKMVWNGKGEMRYKVVNADIEYSHKKSEEYAQKYRIKESYEVCAAVSKGCLEKARQKAQEYGLWEDFDVRSLIEARNPESPSRLTEREVEMEMSRELNELTSCAFNLTVMPGVFKLNGEMEEIISTKKKIVMRICVRF